MPRTSSQQHSRPQPRVAVVTVSYGSGEVLEAFLSSLREFHGDDLPVAMVDNKPDHENVEALAGRYGAVYVPLPENPGYGGGMNAGVAALEGDGSGFDAYFFCNPDARFTEEVAVSLAETLLAGSRLGSIGPRVLNDDGSVYPSARNIPSVGTGVGHALFSKVWKGNPWSRAYTAAAHYDAARPAGWLSGSAVMVRADVYREIGGWDDAYFMHFEDIDLGWRIGRAGYENRYEPSVSLVHSGAHSTKKHAAMVERAMTESAIRFMRKRYAGSWRAPLRWAIVLGLRVRGWIRLRSARVIDPA
jgi:N-acetylglucosaminyl-diphospho-decaprenol L-rhamnosyltransferase